MSSFIQAAFDKVIEDARKPETWYLNLVETVSVYGGPEEGGWWTDDRFLVACQEFPSREAAEAAKVDVLKLAEQLTKESKKEFGERCLREMEFLEARGLDADWLPEPDGDATYDVFVSNEIFQDRHGNRQYS